MKGKCILYVDSEELQSELVRQNLAHLGKVVDEIIFVNNQSRARKEIERLSKEGRKCVIIADSSIRKSDRIYGFHGRGCTSGLLQHALDLGHKVAIYDAGSASSNLQKLIGKKGVHYSRKTSRNISNPELFYQEVLAPLFAKRKV